jgi:hypothetical protein
MPQPMTDTDPPPEGGSGGLPPAEREDEVTLLLRVRLHREPLSGSVQSVGERKRVTFRGWIGFMSAINTLLDGLGRRRQ